MKRAAPHKRGWSHLENATTKSCACRRSAHASLNFLGDDRDQEDATQAQNRAEIRDEQSEVIAEMIKSLSSGVPKERAVEKAFKAAAYWWQIGEHFGMFAQADDPVLSGRASRAAFIQALIARLDLAIHPFRILMLLFGGTAIAKPLRSILAA